MTMDEDREILAAEYALGTLDAAERRQAERLIASDAGIRRARRAIGSGRLSLLAEAVDGVEPPASVWRRSSLRCRRCRSAGTPSGSAEIVYLTRKLNRWRTATYVAGALAASLLLFIGVREATPPTPDRRTLRRRAAGRQGVAGLSADRRSPDQGIHGAPGRRRGPARPLVRALAGARQIPAAAVARPDRRPRIHPLAACGLRSADHQRGDLCGHGRAAGRLADRASRPVRSSMSAS